ncbi:2OG-Fe(II) oxygenase superfamily [Musa troglodytarum]|uniref:2OG-Fe(II) oxygenase superfamily n=1 Tax=Musa troglodytarum TaxID=320322 RepID=A0A9E7K633_9LILI|nr:2OG-Fe(II) oxygenase superfamily [Musa troglodytarum]
MDDLRQWPDPVVPVQSLSDGGLTCIPEKYVKPPSDRPSLEANFDPGLTMPVVDLRGIYDGSVDSRAAMVAIWDACKEWGFFQVINHGVRQDLVEEMKGVWREFFRRPSDEKQGYANSPATYEGYGSRVGVEKGAVLDWGDYYFLHLLPRSIESHDRHWPARPSTLRNVTEEYGGEVFKLCGALLRVLSMGLGLDEEYLRRAFGGDGTAACVRVNLYPKCPQPELTLGLSPHSDPGGLTVLLADDHVEGLQVRKDGAWLTVRPVPGAFIVNVGDQIEVICFQSPTTVFACMTYVIIKQESTKTLGTKLEPRPPMLLRFLRNVADTLFAILNVISNGIYKSVDHRVIASSKDERLSIAFFYNPGGDVAIGPARELLTPQLPPLYPCITFNEYRLYVRKRGPSGKSQMKSLKLY